MPAAVATGTLPGSIAGAYARGFLRGAPRATFAGEAPALSTPPVPMTRSVLSVLVLLLAGCVTRQPEYILTTARAPAPADSDSPATLHLAGEACATRPDWQECADSVERRAIELSGDRVRRLDGVLRIRGTGGAVLDLANDTTTAATTVIYRYLGFVPELSSHLVEIGFYEGGSYGLVSAETTDQTFVQGIPVISPTRSRFVTASVDLEAGYAPNSLQVWRIFPYGPRLEWGLDGGDGWGASDPAWIGEDELEFTMHRRTADPGDSDLTRMRLRIRELGLDLAPAPP